MKLQFSRIEFTVQIISIFPLNVSPEKSRTALKTKDFVSMNSYYRRNVKRIQHTILRTYIEGEAANKINLNVTADKFAENEAQKPCKM